MYKIVTRARDTPEAFLHDVLGVVLRLALHAAVNAHLNGSANWH